MNNIINNLKANRVAIRNRVLIGAAVGLGVVIGAYGFRKPTITEAVAESIVDAK